MEAYFSFLMQHWILSSTFVALIVLFLLNEWRHRTFGVPKISNQQLVDLLNHASATVIDLRAAEGFTKGHILGALNIPQAELSQRLTSLGKYKTKPLILVCAMGNDSPKACHLLKDAGFEKLSTLANGMQGWVQEGMPVTKK